MPKAYETVNFNHTLDDGVQTLPISPELLSETLAIKAVASGRESQAETAVYEGADLKPLSPVHLSAKRIGDETHLSWIRRGRIRSDSWVGEVPLGETEETYRVRVWDGETLLEAVVVEQPEYMTNLSNLTHVDVSQGSSEYGWGHAVIHQISPN